MTVAIYKADSELYANVAAEKQALAKVKDKLATQFIVLVEGDHSEENRVYTHNAADEIRGILAIDRALNALNFNYKRVASTDAKIKDYLAVADYVFIYAQGEYGEDGRIQGWLDYLGVDYPGPGVAASAICCDKLYFKHVMKSAGVSTAAYYELGEDETLDSLLTKASLLQYPVMMKERQGGSSLGITLINNDSELTRWLTVGCPKGVSSYFMEKYIAGAFATVGIIQLSTGYYVLPVLTARTEAQFYDADLKLGKSKNAIHYSLGGNFSPEQQRQLKETAWQAFAHTGCEGISRVDMMIQGEEIFVLEINTVPGISNGGNFTQMFTSFGFSYDEMILAIMNTAFLKHAAPTGKTA